VSHAFPIPDAGFGAIAYVLDILTGAAGDRRRWRTMPWLVLLFGLLIVPLGAVSVGFIIIQPTVIGTLCTLCLVQAAVTVVLIPYSVDGGRGDGAVPVAELARRPAVLAHAAARRAAFGRGPRPRG
jgi:uncharacterized membrane protein